MCSATRLRRAVLRIPGVEGDGAGSGSGTQAEDATNAMASSGPAGLEEGRSVAVAERDLWPLARG